MVDGRLVITNPFQLYFSRDPWLAGLMRLLGLELNALTRHYTNLWSSIALT
ncbi:MAG: hypothetical protein HC921_09480 [Synechococcaceae cyanobacterium SM2_3_1]|nr:hypothetical protein [Synechococcaceae cyanobacterium SM2_3_1]